MSYRISRNLEYALMALAYMSKRKKRCVSARAMTQSLNCPFHPFSRVLQKMADQGLIQSQKGRGKGYIFAKSLNDLSLYELMSAVLPPIEFSACLAGHCDLLDHCNIQNPVHYLNKQFLAFYKSLNVQNILNCGQGRGLSLNILSAKAEAYKRGRKGREKALINV